MVERKRTGVEADIEWLIKRVESMEQKLWGLLVALFLLLVGYLFQQLVAVQRDTVVTGPAPTAVIGWVLSFWQ